MPASAVTTVVITDTNVLINFLHIGQLALLGEFFLLHRQSLQVLGERLQQYKFERSHTLGGALGCNTFSQRRGTGWQWHVYQYI